MFFVHRTCAALACLGAVCCLQKIPVRGEVYGHRVQSTVDDPAAKYYLEDYAAGIRRSPLDARITSLEAQFSDSPPDREELEKISREFSVDFAALFFARVLLGRRENLALQRLFLENLDSISRGTTVYPRKDILILLVPGFDYVDNGPVTGADLARPRAELAAAGYDVELININPAGSVEENAAVIRSRILAHRNRDLAIAGASSAGPAIHLTLGSLMTADETAHVRVWLNLGGILRGAPLLETFASAPASCILTPVFWWKGWKTAFASMAPGASKERFERLNVPAHIRVYNYFGLSLSGSISRLGRDKYHMLRDGGPNDGLSYLPDLIAPNSLSILSPGTDHFFAEDPEIHRKTLALVVTILDQMPRDLTGPAN